MDETTCQCRGRGFYSWSGKIPQALEPLGPCATTKALPLLTAFTLRNHSFILQIFIEYSPPARHFLCVGNAVVNKIGKVFLEKTRM